MKLQGKAAVVTGAARGIGLEIARVLLKNGAKVSKRTVSCITIFLSAKIKTVVRSSFYTARRPAFDRKW